MTLILTMATYQDVIHLSDRQVTLLRGSIIGAIHSAVENKSIVFVVRDAAAVIGYTGSAYIGGKPTDQWLAELISGEKLDDRWSIRMRPRRRDRLNGVVWRLRQALKPGMLPAVASLTLCMSGYRNRRGLSVPFMIELNGPSEAADWYRMRRPRSPQDVMSLSAIGDPGPTHELRADYRAGGSAAPGANENPRRAALISVLRGRASRSDLVGANLMAITIGNPAACRLISWEFMPAASHRAAIFASDRKSEFEAYYSPWIITPGSIYAPSVGTGHMTVHSDGWVIEPIERPAADTRPGGVLFAMSSQDRKLPPGVRRTSKAMKGAGSLSVTALLNASAAHIPPTEQDASSPRVDPN